MNRNILSKAISVVGVIAAAFGGALTKAQPPDSAGQTAGFIGSFACLIILLIISAIASYRNIKLHKIWIGLAVLALAGFIYFALDYSSYKDKYVTAFPKDSPDKEYYIIGDTLGKSGLEVKTYLIKQKLDLIPENYFEYGQGTPNINNLWTPSSRRFVADKLRNKYLLVMILLSLAIFSITEGVFSSLSAGSSGVDSSNHEVDNNQEDPEKRNDAVENNKEPDEDVGTKD